MSGFEVLASLHRVCSLSSILWASSISHSDTVTTGFLVSLCGQPGLGRLLLLPNTSIWEFLCPWGPVMLQISFLSLSPDPCLTGLLTILCTSWLFFSLWHTPSTLRAYIGRCVSFLIMSNEFNLAQVKTGNTPLYLVIVEYCVCV